MRIPTRVLRLRKERFGVFISFYFNLSYVRYLTTGVVMKVIYDNLR